MSLTTAVEVLGGVVGLLLVLVIREGMRWRERVARLEGRLNHTVR